MNELYKLKDSLQEVEKKINISFENKDLLILSFVHPSYVNENKKIIEDNNERLEFLGDTILNFIVSEYLYKKLPLEPEGKLSHIRSRLIDAESCAKYYRQLELDKYLLLGKGEKVLPRGKMTIFSDAFEALIGAIYLDKGLDEVRKFILNNFENLFENETINPEMDYKSKIQEFSQKKYHLPPEYKVINEEGPEHLRIFHVAVFINGEKMGYGKGTSKKQAEQMAAEDAYSKINLED